MRKKVALKYCGGCNPGFDRVDYFNRIRTAAGDLVEWVTLDDRGFEAILFICGCDTACPENCMDCTSQARIVSVRDDREDPSHIAQYLLREGTK